MKLKLFALLAIILLASSCAEAEKTATNATRQVKCEVVTLSDDDLQTATYPGKVYAATEVNLSFRITGVIDKITVKEGDYVRQGQVVALMDKRDYEIQLSATQAEYDGIKSEVERIVALYKEQSVTANDYDKAVNGLKQITSKLEAHKNALNDTELKAPFDGYVQTINFNRGEAVSAGMPVLAYISSSAPEIIINIPSSEYIKRNELTSAYASIDLYPNQVFELQRIGTTHKANLNQLYATRFSIKSAQGVAPAPGMTAMVTLNYSKEQRENTEIAFSAVFERDGLSYVWVLEQGKVTSQGVKLGKIKSNGRVVIESGLLVGQQVVTAGVNSLGEGKSVEPIKKKSKSNVGNIL